MRRVLGMVAALCLLAGVGMAAEVDNPAYQNWAKYKPGTSITYSQKMDAGGMKMQTEMTQTLKELTPEKAVVEMAMSSAMMPGSKQTMDIPAKVEEANAVKPGQLPPGVKGETKSLGKEKLKVGDKEYECEVTQFTGEQQGMKSEGKSWTTDELPGNLVKMEMKATGDQGAMESKMELTKVEIK